MVSDLQGMPHQRDFAIIITDDLKMFYYRGLKNWPGIPNLLRDTYLYAKDNHKAVLEYSKIEH